MREVQRQRLREMTLTCERCNAPAPNGVYCNPCHADNLRGLLSSPSWLAVRGSACGDLPGETLEDTVRRELEGLEVAS